MLPCASYSVSAVTRSCMYRLRLCPYSDTCVR